MSDDYDVLNRAVLDRVHRRCTVSDYRNTVRAIATYHQSAMADDLFYHGYWKGLFMVNEGAIIEYHNPAASHPEGIAERQRTDRRLIFIWTHDINGRSGWCRVVENSALIPVPGMQEPPVEFQGTLNLWRFFFDRIRAPGARSPSRYAELVAPRHIDNGVNANTVNMTRLGMTPGADPSRAALRVATRAEIAAAETAPGIRYLTPADPSLPSNADYIMAVGSPNVGGGSLKTGIRYPGEFPDMNENPTIPRTPSPVQVAPTNANTSSVTMGLGQTLAVAVLHYYNSFRGRSESPPIEEVRAIGETIKALETDSNPEIPSFLGPFLNRPSDLTLAPGAATASAADNSVATTSVLDNSAATTSVSDNSAATAAVVDNNMDMGAPVTYPETFGSFTDMLSGVASSEPGSISGLTSSAAFDFGLDTYLDSTLFTQDESPDFLDFLATIGNQTAPVADNSNDHNQEGSGVEGGEHGGL
ncbi:hypothetical protein ONZ43_g2095 [Nemania bipapillata]|uniref:Uncharacterized protein n=1 Tax=Nemania bipapillata TaxID=110536 RepID=A0ACC2J1Y3_9PEZI|nr:hypothetical protein ONZ43_g2095 [Nemania bipapillata]